MWAIYFKGTATESAGLCWCVHGHGEFYKTEVAAQKALETELHDFKYGKDLGNYAIVSCEVVFDA